MKVSVIIVNHNTGSILMESIESLYRLEDAGMFEVVIVDNFSEDNSRAITEELKQKYQGLKSIYTDSLISFSAANNMGIKATAGEYVLIMNPDIIFTEPVFEKLINKLNNNASVGAITPALTGTDGNFQRNYFQRYPSLRQYIYYSSLLAKLFNRSLKRMNRFLENQDIDITTGKLYFAEQIPCAFFLTKRPILEKIGLMDDNFVLFFEDVDLSFRIAKDHKLAVDTSIKITHLGGSSFKTDDNWWLHGRYIASMIYFFRKHYGSFRTFLLKVTVYLNTYAVIGTEYIKKLFGNKDDYRMKKHKYQLKLLKENK